MKPNRSYEAAPWWRGSYRRRELLTWYVCLRKLAWGSAEEARAHRQTDEVLPYLCPIDATHWHNGRPYKAGKTREELWANARKAYRKDAREGFVYVRGIRTPLSPVYDYREMNPHA